MNTAIVVLPEIAIIGKQGLCTKEKNIVRELWNQANAHFHEVAPLGMKEANGTYVGFWGAMSDKTMSYLPWTDDFSTGYYLAGIEVAKDSLVPDGWIKWILPARTYLKVQIEPNQYSDFFATIITKTLPEMNMLLCGAVCDYTEPATGKNYLLFPIMNRV